MKSDINFMIVEHKHSTKYKFAEGLKIFIENWNSAEKIIDDDRSTLGHYLSSTQELISSGSCSSMVKTKANADLSWEKTFVESMPVNRYSLE